ncbi:MAG: hypothetical protein Q8Q20_01580 [bacterium]|nr:hypothetical protein [bacterium]
MPTTKRSTKTNKKAQSVAVKVVARKTKRSAPAKSVVSTTAVQPEIASKQKNTPVSTPKTPIQFSTNTETRKRQLAIGGAIVSFVIVMGVWVTLLRVNPPQLSNPSADAVLHQITNSLSEIPEIRRQNAPGNFPAPGTEAEALDREVFPEFYR